jgi:lipoprotein-releasing system ATP-binding protein
MHSMMHAGREGVPLFHAQASRRKGRSLPSLSGPGFTSATYVRTALGTQLVSHRTEVAAVSASPRRVQMVDMDMGGSATFAAELHRSRGEQGALLDVRGLRKDYVTGRGRLQLFDGLSFQVQPGELLAVVGASGAGKSTLLHILGALDAPTSGDLYFASIHLNKLSSRQAADFRNREVGYVWQFHYLLPEFTAAENVALPLLARGESHREAQTKALAWLDEVGLADRADHQAGELSGGEQQRVSLARALVTGPRLLLADEPTGDLDATTADRVFTLIQRLHSSHGLTSILVTHNQELAGRCDRVMRLEAGHITQDLAKTGRPHGEPSATKVPPTKEFEAG